jgi:acyl-CoA dehydrogenase
MQLHGGGGVSQEFPLASMWAHSGPLGWGAGPAVVHGGLMGGLVMRTHG